MEAFGKNDGKIIRTLRKMSGMTQEQLSSELNINVDQVNKLENNQVEASEEIRDKIIRITGFDQTDYDSMVETENFLNSIGSIKLEQNPSPSSSDIYQTPEIIVELKSYFKGTKVNKAYLFGSYSRNQQTESSDVDVLIEFDETKNPTIFDLIDIKTDLAGLLHKEVDVIQQGSEYAHIKESMNADKILVYG